MQNDRVEVRQGNPPDGQRGAGLGASRLNGTASLLLRLVHALPWLLWAVSLLLAALGLLLAVLGGLDLTGIFARFLAVNALTAVTFATAGSLIVSRRPENRIGWMLCAIVLLSAGEAFAGPYARYALLIRPAALPAGPLAAWLNLWLWVLPLTLTALVLPLIFPDGRLPSPRWRPLGWLTVLTTILFAAVVAAQAGPDPSLPEVQNPLALEGTTRLLPLAGALLAPLLVASFIGTIAAVVVRLRRSRGDERRQLHWFAYAAALVLIAALVPLLSRLLGFGASDTLLIGVLQALAVPCVPVAVGIAVLRYRLYEIDVLIHRTLVYGALSLYVVALYVLVVGYLGALFQAQDNPSTGSGRALAISLVATGLVAVLFQPLRERVQCAVNRLLYGQRDEPYAVLLRLGQRLEATLAPEAVLPSIVQTVREALKLPYAAIAVRRDGAHTIVAATGPPTADPIRLPLTYQGQAVGELLLGRRLGEQGFSPVDRMLLQDLARQAGVAVHAISLTADLQLSRERLVTAREEERRRLRRDLHDGLGPRLAGLTLRLETARDRLARDPEAETLLADLAERTRETVADIRRLVYALRPPALDDLGLVSALREQAAQYGYEAGRDLHITVEAPEELPPLPAAVEVAAFRIVQEALTNVVRHAGARVCTIRLALDAPAGALRVEIRDDGRGIEPGGRVGVGLDSMRERAEELGGTWSIERLPGGGTLVRVLLRCRRTDANGARGLEQDQAHERGR